MSGMRISIAGAALLMWCCGPAAAGPCTAQINELSSMLGWKDAGSGPTPGAATTTATPASEAAHPPTSATNKAMEGKAASAEDANRQSSGQPTAGDQAQGSRSQVANDQPAARAALERARTLDAQGDEGCRQAVQEARRSVGHTQ
jgi:hypothetical protein